MIVLLSALFFVSNSSKKEQVFDNKTFVKQTENISAQLPKVQDEEPETAAIITPPMSDWQERITKKPFGIKVSPQNSPVQPERFSGYHTGTDFEIEENEIDQELVVYAICKGTLTKKGNVSGYGGVIVQSCHFQNQPITVLYGHISFSKNIGRMELGESIRFGDKLGLLADDKSTQSGGERKHLHLSINKGSELDLRGYVQQNSALASWIDPEIFLNSK